MLRISHRSFWYKPSVNSRKKRLVRHIFNPSGLPILPHLLRQMPSRIVDYSGTTSSPAERDFAMLNLLNCGNTARGGQASTIAQFRYFLNEDQIRRIVPLSTSFC